MSKKKTITGWAYKHWKEGWFELTIDGRVLTPFIYPTKNCTKDKDNLIKVEVIIREKD